MTSLARSRVRRAALAILAVFLLLGGALASLPWIVRIPAVHRMLAGYANSVLSPGSIEFSPMQISWFRPTVVPDVTLRDAEGDVVLAAPALEFEWGLWQLFVNRPKAAQINLTGAKLDIERRPDGTIDLGETLRPVIPEHPRVQLLIHLQKSRLRLRDPLLSEPLLGDDVDVRLDMGRGYEPISWKISMAPEAPRGQSGRLDLEGSYSRARVDRYGRHDTKIALKGTQWPFAVGNTSGQITCRGVLDGTIDTDLQSNLWLAKGETKLTRLELSAPGVAKTVQVDTVIAGWDMKGTESGWNVEKLSLESSLLSLHAEGNVPATSTRAAWLEASINLPDLAQYLPKVLRLANGPDAERGALRLRANLNAGADGMTQKCELRGTVLDLIALEGRRILKVAGPAPSRAQPEQTDDVVMRALAVYDPRAGRLELPELALTFPFVHIAGTGAIRDLGGKADVELNGTLNPDWQALTDLLATRVEPNARIAGQPRPWHVRASIPSRRPGEALETISGDVGIQVDELDVFGMRLGHSALVVRAESGKIRLDPIDATLNHGALHLEAELARDEEGQWWLALGESSHLDGAVINDEVSHRVLSYAAPVLDGATRVKGRISARVEEASFPIWGRSGAQVRVVGGLTLDNVRFVPGRLAEQLLVAFERDEQPLLVLRDSIAVRIQDGKVHQTGLNISVADLASIGLEGTVDFDKNLNLVASVAMNRSAPIAGVMPPLLKNARVDVPIRGTMRNPRIDAEAFKDRLAEMGMDLVGDTMGAGLDGLKRLMEGKSLKGLRDYFLPRARPMSPPPSRLENGDPGSSQPKQPQTAPDERRPDAGGIANDRNTGGSGE